MAPALAWLAAAFLAPRSADAATSAGIITAVSPTSVSRGVAGGTQVTFTGTHAAGMKVTFAQSGVCAAMTPNQDLGGTVTFIPAATVTHEICVRDAGETDSVAQTGVTINVVAATSASEITSFTPTTISMGTASTIALTHTSGSAALSGTKATFATTGNCGTATGHVDATSGSISFTPAASGGHDLCFRNAGGSDSIAQTGAGTLTVQPGTSPLIVTSLVPNGLTAMMAQVVTLGGSFGVGDLVSFALTGTCNINPPSLTPAASMTLTLPAAGTYDVCYREAGGSDSVAQTSVTITVSAASIVANDPVASYNGRNVDFVLPPGKLVPLMRSRDVILHGATFEGQGPWEQWFERIVAESPEGQHWVQVAIRHDLLSFNRSALHRDAFESLEVTLGRGSLEHPTVVSRLPGLDVKVPVSFLDAEVLFRKMHRHYSTTFTTIGRARRECMDFLGMDLHFFVCAAPAAEYFGSPDRHLAIKFAHLNLAFVEAHNLSNTEGALPELWGMRPMSEETASYVSNAKAVKAGLPVRGWPQETITIEQSPDFTKGLAWAGGPQAEDLKRSCTEPDTNATEADVPVTI